MSRVWQTALHWRTWWSSLSLHGAVDTGRSARWLLSGGGGMQAGPGQTGESVRRAPVGFYLVREPSSPAVILSPPARGAARDVTRTKGERPAKPRPAGLRPLTLLL